MCMTNSIIKIILDKPALWKSRVESALPGFSLETELFQSALRTSILTTCAPWSLITLAEGMDMKISSIQEAMKLSTSLRAGISACSKHLGAHGGTGRLVVARFPLASSMTLLPEFTVGHPIEFTLPEDQLVGTRSTTFMLTLAWSKDKVFVKLRGNAETRLSEQVCLDIFCNDRATYVHVRENLISLDCDKWTTLQGLALFRRNALSDAGAQGQDGLLSIFIREAHVTSRRCFKIGHALNLDRPKSGVNTDHEYYA